MSTIISILQMRKLKHKHIKWLTQAHMASLWQSLLLNPGSLDFEFILLLIILF